MSLLRLARHLFLLPVYLYQRTISRLIPANVCRFRPTCSCYFVDAVLQRGIFVGTFKGVWRVCRCNPYCQGGWDPVDPDEPPPWTRGENEVATDTPSETRNKSGNESGRESGEKCHATTRLPASVTDA